VSRLDRLPARAVLPALYAGESLAFLVLALIVGRFSLGPVLVLALLDGTLALTARPVARATTVEVTSSAGLLRQGNAVTQTCFSVALMVGPAVGGAVVAAGGASAALWVNVGLFLTIAVVLATAAHLPKPQHVEEPGGRMRAGLKYARRDSTIRLLLSLQALAVLSFTISVPVEVVLAQHSLHAGASGYGGLLSAWGGGAVAGSAVYARWQGAHARWLMALGAGLIGTGLAAMAVAPTLGVAIAGAAVAGVGNGVETVSARTALQERTDARWMALVMSFSDSLNEAMPGFGIIIGGALATAAGPRPALAVAAAGSLAVTAAIWALMGPSRGLMRAASDPPV
jgi:predicted MFS family arabinose efflux permease